MKTIIFSVLVASVILSGHAEWLSWCVSDFDEFEGDWGEVTQMRVGYVEKNGQDQPLLSGHTLAAYSGNGELLADDGLIDYFGNDARYKVNVTGLNDADYGFYIELLNSSDEVIGRSGQEDGFKYATYDSLSDFISTGDIGDVPDVEIWHGGGSFEAVPEPSSMALLALGAGLVGLRRKLKKGKKEKRA